MEESNTKTNWPWLVAGGMFNLKTPLIVVTGYARLLETGKLGPVTDKQREALQQAQKSIGDIREIVDALTGLASLEGAWPPVEVEKVRLSLGKLLIEIAGSSLERVRAGPIEIRAQDEHDEVVGIPRLLKRALGGLSRFVVMDEFKDERPLSIWVVDSRTAPERWIVFAPTDQIQKMAEMPRESLTALDDRPRRMSMDLPYAGAVVRAHGGQLLALPDGVPGAVATLPCPADGTA